MTVFDAISTFQQELSEHLGEDCDFEAIDDTFDTLWRNVFDALGMPQGKIRTDVVHDYMSRQPNFDSTNIAHAYAIKSDFYDHTYDTKEN